MKFHENLNDFNRLFAARWLSIFPEGVKAYEMDDGTLLFRGPVPIPSDLKHVGTHVAVSVEPDVAAALESASASEREEMHDRLIESLGGQVQVRYDPNNIGLYALDIVGKMNLFR